MEELNLIDSKLGELIILNRDPIRWLFLHLLFSPRPEIRFGHNFHNQKKQGRKNAQKK